MAIKTRYATISRAIKHYGFEGQLTQLAQEATELAHAILKRMQSGEHSLACVAEEIADVKIMLAQVEQFMPPGHVEAFVATKLDRLDKRLDNDNAEE